MNIGENEESPEYTFEEVPASDPAVPDVSPTVPVEPVREEEPVGV